MKTRISSRNEIHILSLPINTVPLKNCTLAKNFCKKTTDKDCSYIRLHKSVANFAECLQPILCKRYIRLLTMLKMPLNNPALKTSSIKSCQYPVL